MGTLGIRNIGDNYWLSSRDTFESSFYNGFGVRVVSDDGSTGFTTILSFSNGSNNPSTSERSYGIRPVFILHSDIKVNGGDGETPDTPYILSY